MTRRRTAPAHVRAARASWLDATLVWERERETACNGWPTEMAEWQADNPAPRFRDYLADIYARMRAERDAPTPDAPTRAPANPWEAAA